jgi:hypothetical protein
MRSNTLASVLALSAAALASPAVASLNGFRLPGERPQQEPPTDVQGPVAPDVPASRRLAPTPTPSASQPEPTTAPPPRVEVPTFDQPTAAPGPARLPPSPAARASAAASGTAPPVPAPTGSAVTPPAVSLPIAQPSGAVEDLATPTERSGWSWLWLLAAVPLLLAAFGFAVWSARRRAGRPVRADAPPIERPRLKPAEPVPPPAPVPVAPIEPLQVSLEPLRLSLTLMNATLAYRLELANRGASALTGVTIGADMISAHASLSREEQLSGPRPGNGAPPLRIERLEPGESRVVDGEFRLPFRQIVPIRQGDAALLLPLARFRVEAEGAGPVVRTFVVGQPGQGSGLQPFRLDQGPRVFPRLAQHAFA